MKNKIMEETLVSFTVAKLAKEKGFNEYCIMAYFKDDQISLSHCYSLKNDECRLEDEKYAPTQALLLRWLREKHNIDVVVFPWKDHAADVNDKHTYRPMIYRVKTFSEYKTYEEALEVGLFEALKLIT